MSIVLMRKVVGAALALMDRRTPEAQFFRKPYDERRREVRDLYSDEVKQTSLRGYFDRGPEAIEREITDNFRFFFDVMLGYALALRPRSVMQLGCFTATELQWLKRRGFEGRLIAADHSQPYLEFLRSGFSRTNEEFEYRSFDLDVADCRNFEDVEMVTALAVIGNIQPESMDRLFSAIAESGVRLFAIGDTYVRQSLSGSPGAPSIPLHRVRNWCHPYRALARAHGFDSVFLPDVTYSSYLEARGIFVISRGLVREQHLQAMNLAYGHYLDRQDQCWDAYGSQSAA
jgi:hypothetical protein